MAVPQTLTEHQQIAFNAIKRLTRDGLPTTFREIAQELQCSVATAKVYVERLKRAGYVVHESTKARTIRPNPARKRGACADV